MTTNASKSVALVNISSTKQIATISYVDANEEYHEVTVNYTEYEGVLQTSGADKITVTYQDGTSSVINLLVDESAPSKQSVMANVSSTGYRMEITDNNGIASITYGGETYNVANHPKRVILHINIVQSMGLSVGKRMQVLDDNGTATLTITSDEPSGDVVVDNILGGQSVLTLQGATVDSTGPEASVVCENGYFVLTATDEESGILKVVGGQTGNDIFVPAGCPATFTSTQRQYPQGDTSLIVYNGVGLTQSVDLDPFENITGEEPIVLWKYKNTVDNSVRIEIQNEGEKNKLVDKFENIRVIFEGVKRFAYKDIPH